MTTAVQPDAFQAGAFQLSGAPAAAGAFSLTLQAGAYTLTGQSLTLVRSYALSCEPGAYVLTGNAATLTIDRGEQEPAPTGGYAYERRLYSKRRQEEEAIALALAQWLMTV